MADKVSVLVNDLTNIPNIISSLGLGISAAQRAFNLDYLESLERLFALAKVMSEKLDPPQNADASDAQAQKNLNDIFTEIVKGMAPSRYQFTETTMSVRMDLGQSMQSGSSASLGASVGAVAVNAAFTSGFSYDYRAAAEIKTVIHAMPFNPQVMNTLLQKAKEFGDKTLEIPERTSVDKAYMDKSIELQKKLTSDNTNKTNKQIEEVTDDAADSGTSGNGV